MSANNIQALLAQVKEMRQEDPEAFRQLIIGVEEVVTAKSAPETLVKVEALGGIFVPLNELAFMAHLLGKASAYYLLTPEQKEEHAARKGQKVGSMDASYLYGQQVAGEALQATLAKTIAVEADATLAAHGYTKGDKQDLMATLSQ